MLNVERPNLPPVLRVTVTRHPPSMMDEYQNKGLTKLAFHKWLILKGLDCSAIAEAPRT
jgi:hypothetical protein